MPFAWIALAANVAGGIAGASAAKKNAKAQQQAANQIINDTAAYKNEGFGLIGASRSKGEGYLAGVTPIKPFKPIPFTRSLPPDDPRFINGGLALSRISFDTQTGQKRENLDFILGDTQDNLRKSQSDFSALAAGDTSAFSKELRASSFGALADSFGAPAGTFGNISARNQFAFRTEGLRNSLAIGDFFAEQGTVDPVDPLPSIFALAEFEQKEDAEKQALDQFNRTIDFEVARHNSGLSLDVARTGIGFETSLLGAGLDVLGTALDYTSNARLIGAQSAGAGTAALGQSLNTIGQGLGQLAGGSAGGAGYAQTGKAYASFLGGNSTAFSDLF